ncbi:MAG: hypothetical protein ABJ360_03515 [Roseobacter sp.]
MNIYQEEIYQKKRIEVTASEETLELRIDGKKVAVTADRNGNLFLRSFDPTELTLI